MQYRFEPWYAWLDATNVAIPEALLYHGLSVEEGRHVVDILECDHSLIRGVINDKHGAAMGADALPKIKDRLLKEGSNPLHVMADVFERLPEKPGARTTSTGVVAAATSSCSANPGPAGACGP